MKCEHCGAEFASDNKRRKYCSIKCRRAAELDRKQNLREDKTTCLICGKSFVRRTGTERYCSAACRDEMNRRWQREHQKPVLKRCAACGKEFTPRNNKQKYCSPDFYNETHKKQAYDYKILQRQTSAQNRAQAVVDKQVKRPTKTLDDWCREAAACGLDYGNYRALVALGHVNAPSSKDTGRAWSPQLHDAYNRLLDAFIARKSPEAVCEAALAVVQAAKADNRFDD